MLADGTRVGGYQVTRLLGEGGMGQVYLARDVTLGRRVALKRLSRPYETTEQFEQFLTEARITARFNHPHIVTVYGFGEHEGHPYVALEYLEGQDLRQRLESERPGIQESARIALAIAEALEEAHAHNVIHWDLKPENVMLPKDGRLRVVDFGIAKALPGVGLDGAEVEQVVVERGQLVGTPRYMAPERMRAAPCTAAVDVWALGLIMHELLTGTHPYPLPADQRGLRRLMATICEPGPVPSVGGQAQVPGELADLVDRCLAKDPGQRPTAGEVVVELEYLLAQSRERRAAELHPYRGLLPFSQRHAGMFFGRSAEVAEFLERLREQPLLAVVGPSGAGKSSFVQAGVFPRLEDQGRWLIAHFRPGNRPFDALLSCLRSHPELGQTVRVAETVDLPVERAGGSERAGAGAAADATESATGGVDDLEAIRHATGQLGMVLQRAAEQHGAKVLLLVDQFEELFSLGADAELRHRFVQSLCQAADDPYRPVRIVLTLRDDFLVRLAETPAGRDVLAGVTVLQRPDSAALHEVVARPLAQAGYRFEDPALVEEMIHAVRDEQACLPLLQFACSQLWAQRDRSRKLVTRQAYDAIGGVEGAVARHADATLAALTPSQIALARALFLRLVTAEGTRRIVAQSQLLAGLGPAAAEVLGALTRQRAVLARKAEREREGEPAGEPEYELVHESLIRNWTRLRAWLEESRDELAFVAEVREAAKLWERRGRRPDEVWQGAALREATTKAARFSELPDAATRFLAAGQSRERRRARRKRYLLVAAFAVLASVALVVGLKEREATRQRGIAERQRAEAQREGAAAALERMDLLEARAKLRGALETVDSPPARALWWLLERHQLVFRRQFGTIIYDVAYSPDGHTIAAAGMGQAVYLMDTRTAALRVLRGYSDQVLSVAFSPDGRTLAAGTWGGVLGLYDLSAGTLRSVDTGGAMLSGLAFGPDGRQLATVTSGGPRHDIELRDARTGALLRRLEGHTGRIMDVAFSPDGELLASASIDKTARLWRLDTGQSQVLGERVAETSSVAFRPDGRQIATSSDDKAIRIFSTATGEVVRTIRGHKGWLVLKVRYSPDGKLLASAGSDATVRLWDPDSGAPRGVFAEATSEIRGLAFGPEGGLLLAGSYDGTVRLWNTASTTAPAAAQGHSGGVTQVAFNADGTLLASAGQDGVIGLWDAATGRQLRTLRGHEGGVYDVAFHPHGELLASGGTDRTVRLWDVGSGDMLKVLYGHEGAVFDVAFGPDGTVLGSVGADPMAALWDVTTGTRAKLLGPHPRVVRALSFAPAGDRVATAGPEGALFVWDAKTGQRSASLGEPDQSYWGVAFGADGQTLFSSAMDGTLRRWRLDDGSSEEVGTQPGRAYWIAVHPDGARVGASCSDGTARIWDLEQRGAVELRGHTAEVGTVAFHPDGQLVATASDDGTVRLWRADTGRPAWRAPLLRPRPPELLTDRGWISLAGEDAPVDASRAPWRRAVTERARAASASPQGSICLATYDDRVELWNDHGAEPLAPPYASPGLRRVLALERGCAVLTATGAGIVRGDGSWQPLLESASAMTWTGAELLIASGDEVLAFGASGERTARYDGVADATALARVGDWLVLGFRDGNLELLPAAPGLERPDFGFEDVPGSPVRRVIPGPLDTVVVGYDNGSLGIWYLRNGARLYSTKLHGAIVHLALDAKRLCAASELGQHRVEDLTVFYQDHCDLLRDIWAKVPVVWRGGLPVLEDAPASHHCRAASPTER